MIISTKGRYALRVLIALAERNSTDYVPMKEIAQSQGISLKYMERILPVLTQNNLLDAHHGKGGGYRLNRAPNACSVGEVLRLTEGSLAPVSCLEKDAAPCARADKCRTLSMWQNLQTLLNNFFDNITLADLMQTPNL